jgi:hypothetical protein
MNLVGSGQAEDVFSSDGPMPVHEQKMITRNTGMSLVSQRLFIIGTQFKKISFRKCIKDGGNHYLLLLVNKCCKFISAETH